MENIKFIFKYIFLVLLLVALFLFMEFSQLFLKDKKSVAEINYGLNILEIMNQAEMDQLNSEKEKLTKELEELQRMKMAGISKVEKIEIEKKIETVLQSIKTNEDTFVENRKEQVELKSNQKNPTDLKKYQKIVSDKNDEIGKLLAKNAAISKENQNNTKTTLDYKNALRTIFITYYKDNPKKIEQLTKEIDSGSNFEIINNELKIITAQAGTESSNTDKKENDIQKYKDMLEQKEKEYKTILSEKDRTIAGLNQKAGHDKNTAQVQINPASTISSIENVIESNGSDYPAIMKEYNTLKKSGTKNSNPEEYYNNLLVIVKKIFAQDKKVISDRNKKLTKNAEEIMRLLRDNDAKTKELENRKK
jgi:hypothetical protein